MDDALSRGLPFDLSNIWRQSAFQPDQNSDSLFQALPTDFTRFELTNADKLYQQDFHIPELSETNGVEGWGLERIESEVASPATAPIADESQALEAAPDVWTLDFGIEDQSRLHTWEAFERKDVPNADHIAYLSEAGPKVFDAALIHLERRAADSGVLPQDVMLRALCNLASGRSSLLFQWDSSKGSFVSTLPDVPMSGYSSATSGSFLASIIDHGSSYRHLDEFASATLSPKYSCTAAIAFRGGITSMLSSIEEHITRSIIHTCSILQLQSLVERPHQLLNIMRKLVCSVENCETDEHVISALSDCVHQITRAETCFGETLNAFLARVSAPWLEQLCADLGLTDDRLNQGRAGPDEGEEYNTEYVDSSFEEHAQQMNSLSVFINTDDRALIQQTKASMKVLRQHLPDHCIALSKSTESECAALIQSGSAALLRTGTEVSNTVEALATHSTGAVIDHSDGHSEKDEYIQTTNSTEDLAWSHHDVQQEYLAVCDARMSQPLESPPQSFDPLQTTLAFALEKDGSQSESAALLSNMEFNPVERLRPLIWAHGRRINKTVLRHLFWNCRLRHHLDLQRQYHLLGSGDFITRLTTALFSTDTQTAERKRGTIPTGETIGLRLGARDEQRWPPASSELRLTLMGVLTETYRPGFADAAKTKDAKELPGGLSFSIRELPDKDIERVMDSSSVYALDFLRLQYNAPPCLDTILTPSSMQAYDGVFRFLLRILRMLHVTTMLREKLGLALRHESGATSNTQRQFTVAAHHLVTVLMSHFMDIGINAPWKSFIFSLDEVERALKTDYDNVQLLGLDGLRKLHDTCLGSIRSRLFLRRKHEKIRNAIESVFMAILQCASNLEREEAETLGTDFAGFEKSTTELRSLLRTAVDKSAKIEADIETAESDTQAIRLLLTRLDWNDFYSNAS